MAFPILVRYIPARYLFLIVGALVAIPFTFLSVSSSFILTHERAHLLGMGTWLALLQSDSVPRPRLASLGVAFLALGAMYAVGGHISWFWPVEYALIVTLVYAAVTRRFTISCRPLRFLGVRCYSLYLLHMFVLAGLERLDLPPWPILPPSLGSRPWPRT